MNLKTKLERTGYAIHKLLRELVCRYINTYPGKTFYRHSEKIGGRQAVLMTREEFYDWRTQVINAREKRNDSGKKLNL